MATPILSVEWQGESQAGNSDRSLSELLSLSVMLTHSHRQRWHARSLAETLLHSRWVGGQRRRGFGEELEPMSRKRNVLDACVFSAPVPRPPEASLPKLPGDTAHSAGSGRSG